MSWTFKPMVPVGYSFSGDMVYNSTEIEIPDSIIKNIDSVNHEIRSMYSVKLTGFETVLYQITDSSEHLFSIMFVGNLSRWIGDLLTRLAVAMNGAGMVLQFKDTWITGTDASPVTYYCRWINAGDFVDSNILYGGASMNLHTFSFI